MIQTLKAKSLHTSPIYRQTTGGRGNCPRH